MTATLAALAGCGGGDGPAPAPDEPGVSVVAPVALARAPMLRTERLLRVAGWSFSELASADLDADGRPDLVAFDAERGFVVRLATGSVRRVRLPGGVAILDARDLALADADGDRRLDALVVGRTRGVQAILAPGDGRGGLRRPRRTALPGLPTDGTAGAVADLTGDGRPDVVRALLRSGPQARPGAGVTVSPGRGDGTFGPAVTPTRVRSTSLLAVADLDGDGRPDVVTDRAVTRGLGGGRFAPAEPLRPLSFQRRSVLGGEVLARWDDPAGRRLGLLTHDGRPLRRIIATQAAADPDDLTSIPDAPMLGVPGLGAVFSGPRSIVFALPRPGGRFAEPIATPVPEGGRALVALDADRDGDPDLATADEGGRLLLLRNRGPAPVARLTIGPAGAIAGGRLLVDVACSAGAGSCHGTIGVRGRAGDQPLALGAGARGTVRLPAPRTLGPRRTLVVRQDGVARPASRRIAVRSASAAERARACRPALTERVLASSTDLVVIGREAGPPVACLRATGRLRQISTSAVDTAVAARGPFVAVTDDVCPGGFEDCYLDVVVVRFPAGRIVARVNLDRAVARVAVGRDGALAIARCTPAGEGPECEDPARDVEIVRVDGRGATVVASGPGIAGASLRAAKDGRTFRWRRRGALRTAGRQGAPPRTSRPSGWR